MESEPASQARIFDEISVTLPAVEFRPDQAAVLVVDMQYYDCSPDHGFGLQAKERGKFEPLEYFYDRMWKTVVPGLQRLLEASRRSGVPVIYCRVGSRTPGGEDLCLRYRAFKFHELQTQDPHAMEILDELAPKNSDIVLTKSTQNVFISTPFDQILRNLGVHQIVMTGVATNNCVESATRTAADLSYECFIVEDGCAAYTEEQHKAALDNMDGNLGWVVSSDDLIAILERSRSQT